MIPHGWVLIWCYWTSTHIQYQLQMPSSIQFRSCSFAYHDRKIPFLIYSGGDHPIAVTEAQSRDLFLSEGAQNGVGRSGWLREIPDIEPAIQISLVGSGPLLCMAGYSSQWMLPGWIICYGLIGSLNFGRGPISFWFHLACQIFSKILPILLNFSSKKIVLSWDNNSHKAFNIQQASTGTSNLACEAMAHSPQV